MTMNIDQIWKWFKPETASAALANATFDVTTFSRDLKGDPLTKLRILVEKCEEEAKKGNYFPSDFAHARMYLLLGEIITEAKKDGL